MIEYYSPSSLTGINLFVLNSNIIYRSIVFENRIEYIKYVTFLHKLN
jgi:hypothetical protein